MSDALKKVDFGNEAADDVDPEELESYFVEQSSFEPFLDPKKRLLIATARKGVGKSALLQWTAQKAASEDPEALVIKIRGSDLARANFSLSAPLVAPNDHIRDWMVRLCTVVNRHLAHKIDFALSDDAISLVETAEIEGFKSRNLVSCLLERMQTLMKDRKLTRPPIQNEVALLKRFAEKADHRVWVIIDDLNATYQNTPAESINLATFFSACRHLTRDLKGTVIRVSMRTDVWPVIRRVDEALDKADQYVVEISWSRDDFLRLLAARVRASLGLNREHEPGTDKALWSDEYLLDKVFTPKMQWVGKEVKSYHVLYTLSYERPRWSVQLCKLARESALRHHRSHINKESIDEVWGEYGTKRIADLVAEHKHQCPDTLELLTAFRGSDRLLTRSGLLSWINNRIVNHMEVNIEGKRTRSNLDIALYLYRIGFIVARSDEAEGFEHYRYDQLPDVFDGRTNEDFGLTWEIHPCYREALDIKKIAKSHRERFGNMRNKN